MKKAPNRATHEHCRAIPLMMQSHYLWCSAGGLAGNSWGRLVLERGSLQTASASFQGMYGFVLYEAGPASGQWCGAL